MGPNTNFSSPAQRPPNAAVDRMGDMALDSARQKESVRKDTESRLRYEKAADGTPEYQRIATDQSKLDLVRGIPVDTGSGIQYLPHGVQERFTELSRVREMSEQELTKLRERMMKTVNDYIDSLRSAAGIIRDAAEQEAKHGGSVLDSSLVKAAREVLANDPKLDTLREEWMAYFDAAVLIIRAESEGKAADTLWIELQKQNILSKLTTAHATALENVLVPSGKQSQPVTGTLRDAALSAFKSLTPLGLTFDKQLLSILDAEIVRLDQEKHRLDIERGKERRKFHNAMVGTDDYAESVLSFATLEDGKVDFNLLEKQLVALGVIAATPLTTSVAANATHPLVSGLVKALNSVGVNTNVSILSQAIGLLPGVNYAQPVELTEPQRKQLVDYIRQIQEHDGVGFSVADIYRKTVERSMVRQHAENLVQSHLKSVAFDYEEFSQSVADIQKRFPDDNSHHPSILPGGQAQQGQRATGLEYLNLKAVDVVGFGDVFLTESGKSLWVNELLNPAHAKNADVKAALEAAYDRCVRRRYFDQKGFDTELQAKYGITSGDPKVSASLHLTPEKTLPEDWDSAELTTLLLEQCKTKQDFEKEVETYMQANKANPFAKQTFEPFLTRLNPALTYDQVLVDIGISAGTTTVPEHWHPSILWNYLRRKEIEQKTGFEAATIDLPWDQDFKEALRVGSGDSQEALEVWWAWIASLPKNFYDATQNDEYTKVLEKKDALEDARDAFKDVSSGYQKKGEDAMQEAFDGILAKQTALAELLRPLNPAQGVKEHIEGIRRLYGVATAAFDFLEKETSFATLLDPRIRRIAFYICLTKGSDEAKKYLENPANYSFDPPLKKEVDDYLKRFDDAQEHSGRDILLEMRQKYGLMVTPRAWIYLTHTMGPYGMPLSEGPTRVENWLSNPHLSGPALLAILSEDPLHAVNPPINKQDFVQAFVTGTDVGSIKSADVRKHVSLIVRHLLRQSADAQLSAEQNRSPERFVDPLNMLRSGWDSVKEMLNGDTAEKALGVSLIVGAGYALYSMWKKGGMGKNLIIGVPLFFGMDVALKNATGSGLMDRLSLNYMSPEERNSAREQFLRGMAKEDRRLSFLDSDVGDACVRELAHPQHPIPVSQLLSWRETVHSRGGPALFDTPGAYDFSRGSPAGLSTQSVIQKLGILPAYMKQRSGLKAEAYRKLFFTFEALCVQVAQINDLGGDTLEEKAERGATLMKHRYVLFDEQYLQDTGMGMYMNQTLGPNVSMLDVMVYERTTPAVIDAMLHSTFVEWMAAKIGITVEAAREKLRSGWTWVQIEAEHRKEQVVEDLYPWAKKNVLSSYDSFMEWANATYHRGWGEVKENWIETYHLLTGVCSDLGIIMYYHGPGAIEWVYEGGASLVGGAGEKIHRAWLELHAHQITGDAAEAVESLLAFLASNAPMESAETLADVNVLKRDLAAVLSRVSELPAGGSYETLVEKWLKDIGVADPRYLGELAPAQGATPRERLMRAELLKREVFSFIAAQRIESIKTNQGQIGWLPGTARILIPWPTFDVASMKFTGASTDVQNTYDYLRSQYTSKSVLPLIGQARTVHGRLEDISEQNLGTATGTTAWAIAGLTDWFLRDKSGEYVVKSLNTYFEPLDAEGKRVLPPVEYEYYKHYLNVVAVNALLEAALQGPQTEPADLSLSIRAAKDYLYYLKTKRGDTPDPSALLNEEKSLVLLQKFKVVPLSNPSDSLKAVIQDPNGRWLIQGVASQGVGVSGNSPSNTPVIPNTPSSAQNVLPPATIDALITTANLQTVSGAQQLLQCLPSSTPAQISRIRQKFNAVLPALQVQNNHDLALLYLLGIEDASVYRHEDALFGSFLKDMSGFDALKILDSYSDNDSKHRTDHLRWRLTANVLPAIVSSIAAKQNTNLLATTSTEQALLVRLLNEVSHPDLRDAVSLPMEYIFCDGDWDSKDFTSYNTFLTTKGVTAPLQNAPSRNTWTRLTSNFEHTSEERFANSHSVRSALLDGQVFRDRIHKIPDLLKYP